MVSPRLWSTPPRGRRALRRVRLRDQPRHEPGGAADGCRHPGAEDPAVAPGFVDGRTLVAGRARPAPALGTVARPVVRPMLAADLAFVAAEHARSLPDGLVARLGPGFLRRYHRAQLRSAGAVALVAELGGERVGFLTGRLDRGLTQDRRALPRLAVAAFLAVLRRPSLARPVVQTSLRHLRRAVTAARVSARSRGGDRPPVGPNSPAGRSAVVSYLAVTVGVRGRGVGSVLLEDFSTAVRAAGCTGATLATLDGPRGARAFYEAHGWQAVGWHRPPGAEPLRVMARTWSA